ncbi:MAG: hypothetical protein KKB50_15520 [Planctomycetes bacterium]|nr:hypothetical protein [Planctomycetota bacterium]
MVRIAQVITCVLIVGTASGAPAKQEAGRKVLWQIGRADGNTGELALGPDGYRQYHREAFFIVGQSKPEADWPYVQPGPVDAWAGSRAHTFTIMFALREPPTDGTYRLVVDLADAQMRYPPVLHIACNGKIIAEQATLAGQSDRSIEGEPAAGRAQQFAVEIAGTALVEVNRLELTTATGCWVLYDALRFEAPSGAQLAPVPDGCMIVAATPQACLRDQGGELKQPVVLDAIRIGAGVRARCRGAGKTLAEVDLRSGRQDVTVCAPAVQQRQPLHLTLDVNGQVLAEAEVTLEPVRHWVIYLMHHTHLDIGYTHTQEQVEQRQMEFLDQVQDLIHATDDYPPAARFKWLPEGLWAVESYLKAADETQRAAFLEAARAGRIGLDALYGNALTGLYSQEELFELVDYALRLREQYGLTIDSAMISDVPGYTWGLVPVLAQCGIKYLSAGPNSGHRVGHTFAWADKPFYWVSSCGRHRILFWMAGKGYSWFHGGRPLNARRLFEYLAELEASGYPYDLVQLRYSIGADNGPPDPHLSDFVRKWNEEHAYPKIIVCTTSQMFHDFEQRYGDRLPTVRGDFTPYWEDGAASTAADTAANRHAAEKLVQARTLWALLNPGPYPDERFYAAWRNAVLYDEHTWGAYNSISRPDHPFARRQAEYKQQMALQAKGIADESLAAATAGRLAEQRPVRAVEVFNTCSWLRTDVVVLPAETELAGEVVRAADGAVLPAQRLSTGELAFLATDVPPLGSARFAIEPGSASGGDGRVVAEGTTLSNGLVTVRVDERTGAIAELSCAGRSANLVDQTTGYQLNDYVYVAGRNPDNQERVGSASITVLERGPLVGTLEVKSTAPGARSLVRRISLVSGMARVDITNIIDKLPIREQEGVHFAFPLNVPGAVVRLDMPWAVVRPEADQIAGACKNFFAVQRWVDVSNVDGGVTFVTRDAPLVQMGAIRTDVTTPFAPEAWLARVEHSPTLFSYVMNNYWETNYQADQEGPTTFRYALCPYAGAYDQVAATRCGLERLQPLIAIPACADGPAALAPAFELDAPGMVVSSLKPSRDGRAWIVRLYAASGKPERVTIRGARADRTEKYHSGQDEVRRERLTGPLELPPYGVATLRLEPVDARHDSRP